MKHAGWLLALMFPAKVFGIGADENTRPTPPPEARYREKPVESAPRSGDGVVEDEQQVLVDSLAGVAVGPNAATALRLQRQTRAGVSVEGFDEAEAALIRRIAAKYIGKPVRLASLNAMVGDIESAFRRRGSVLRRVSYPPQEITTGVVALRAGRAGVGRLRLAGAPSFGAGFALRSWSALPGRPLDEARLLDDLDWLNENPLRRATVSQSPGGDPDEIDLTLRLRSPRPWRVYGGIDNQLSENLGDERLFLGWQYGDLFGLDHRFTGQLTSALEEGALLGASVIHEIPLPGRHLLGISGGYTESETDLPGPLDQSGDFARVALEHRWMFPRWRSLAHEWRSGMEFRNNDYLFPGGTDRTVRFFQLETGWKGKRPDRYGMTALECGLLWNPGQGVLGSDDEDYIALGADGAESLILRADLERSLRLGKAGSLMSRLRAQWADSALLSSDQISAGGMTRVRGFDEIVGYASSGMIATLEWQSPVWNPSPSADLLGVCFLDGALLDRDQPGDPGQLLSAGFGCRWRWTEQCYGRLECGFPLDCPDDIDSDPMLHFAVGFNW